jgi:hypothetical protein
MRIDDALWDAVGEVVGPRNRSTLVRDLLRWWLRIPGAKMPPRPGQPPVINHRRPERPPRSPG